MYALCILLGIIVALRIGAHRFEVRGGARTLLYDCALFAIPAGIVGGRIYHVLTSPEAYFGSQGVPRNAFKIWEGGLGIWGAISLGCLTAYLVYRRANEAPPFSLFADALAPALLVAQGIGRWGNWFNGELFGRPLHQWWALEIPVGERPVGLESFTTFHPIFLYESLWCLGAAILLIAWERKRILASGSIFAGYIFLYCLGRAYFEKLRVDQAHIILGARLNFWVAVVIAIASLAWLMKKNPRSRANQVN